MSDDIYVAKQSATFTFQGRQVFITGGKTTVREGHPMLEEFPSLFEPIKVTYELEGRTRTVESATAAPGERRTIAKRGGARRGPRPSESNEGPTQGLTTDSIGNTP